MRSVRAAASTAGRVEITRMEDGCDDVGLAPLAGRTMRTGGRDSHHQSSILSGQSLDVAGAASILARSGSSLWCAGTTSPRSTSELYRQLTDRRI